MGRLGTFIIPSRNAHVEMLWQQWLILFACILLTTIANATEQEDRQFFDQLQRSGHDQLATEFLERAESDPLISKGFKQSARFEKVSLGIAVVRTTKKAEDRKKQLEKLSKQIDGLSRNLKSDSERIAFARMSGDLATAFADEARRDAQSIDKPRNAVPVDDARESIKLARTKLSKATDLFEKEHVKLRGVSPDSEKGKTRLDLLGRLAQMRLMSSRMLHELAMTHEPGSKQYKKNNETAAKELGALYEKYSRWMVGLYAHLYEGQCYRSLNKVGLAAGCFEDLIGQPTSSDELRRLVTNAQAQLAALWFESGSPEKSIDGPRRWLSDLSSSDQKTPEAAMLQYYVAKSHIAIAEKLPEVDPGRRNSLRKAGLLLSASSRVPSDVQAEAREAWAELSKMMGISNEEAKDFDQAFLNGKQAIEQIATLKASLQEDANLSKGDRQQLEEQISQQQQTASNAFQQAMKLADKKTEPKQLNEARYLLAWLTFESGDLSRAADMAEYLLKKAPEDPSAEKGALLGLAALEQLSMEGDASAGERMKKLADTAAKNWPNSEIANTSYNVLLNIALRAKDYQAASELVSKLPEYKRPEYALRIATARWEALIADKNAKATKRNQIYATLKKSFKQAKGQGKTFPQGVTAALYLARESLAQGRNNEAVQFLIDDQFGPVSKLIAKEPPADAQRFATLVAQSALEAYVTNGNNRLKKSVQWLDDSLSELDKEIAMKTRLAVAVPIVAKLDSKPPVKKEVSQRIVNTILPLLGKIEKNTANKDWNTRAWVAQTYLKFGQAAKDQATANKCMQSAASSFHTLVDQIRLDPSMAPTPAAALAVQLQAANCDRELGEYEKALNSYEALLSKKQALLPVQVAVAEALQALGEKQKRTELLEESINGSRPDASGKNVFWGWRKIAGVTARAIATNEGHKETFFNAWYNVARSRYLAAKLSSPAEAKKQYSKALSTIKAMRRQYPDLGGKASAEKYDALEKQIAKEMK